MECGFQDEDYPDAASCKKADEPIILKLRTWQRISYAIYGMAVLFLAAMMAGSARGSGVFVGLLVGLTSIFTFLLGVVLLAGSFPGTSYLRMDSKGILMRHILVKRYLPWPLVTSIGEKYRGVTRGSSWGVKLSTQAGNGNPELFIPDIYSVKRLGLVQLMKILQKNVSPGNS